MSAGFCKNSVPCFDVCPGPDTLLPISKRLPIARGPLSDEPSQSARGFGFSLARGRAEVCPSSLRGNWREEVGLSRLGLPRL